MKKSDGSGSKKGGGRDRRKSICTAAQRRVRKNPGWFSDLWNNVLTEAQRIAWRRLAKYRPRRVRKRKSYRLRGKQVFIMINSVLACLGREPRTDPPPPPKPATNPVEALEITGTGASLALKLRVSETPANEIMVFGSPPQNAGRKYCGDFRFLGLLPTAIECVSDITRLYLKKFGVPRGNSRVFIRTWPEANGWEYRGQMQISSALVPMRGGVGRRG